MTTYRQDILGPLPWNNEALPLPFGGWTPRHPEKTRKPSAVLNSRHRAPDRHDNHGPETDEAQDAACVERVREGESKAFDRLVDRYSARIYAHVYRLVRNREEAEDMTQETFVRAYRFLNRFDSSRPFRNWLYTIATNVGLNALRAQKRRGQTIPLDSEAFVRGNAAAATPADGLKRSLQGELRERLADAVARLPERSSALVHLRYQEGMTIREAAEVVGMSEGAAKVALHRARKTLREWFSKEEQ